jgi:L-glyceraldehyde 3-phosphate reductase
LYIANEQRYDTMQYRRCGRSGVRLPAISLGLWHNFGGVDVFENCRAMVRRAFDLGITHFDLANNYGPPPGSAESNFGEILRLDLKPSRRIDHQHQGRLRDMWPGPYGDWGSRKYLLASLDQSLKRMGLEYVDIFYSHRPDPETPVEETMSALDQAVRSGKALYAGISSYNPEQTTSGREDSARARHALPDSSAKYSMFERTPENGLLDVLGKEGVGGIAFCPLAQGLLTDRYLKGIPEGSRATKPYSFLKKSDIDESHLVRIRALNELAAQRGQSLAQMALAWVLRDSRMTSALIGASRVEQIEQNVAALANLSFSASELARINAILSQSA